MNAGRYAAENTEVVMLCKKMTRRQVVSCTETGRESFLSTSALQRLPEQQTLKNIRKI